MPNSKPKRVAVRRYRAGEGTITASVYKPRRLTEPPRDWIAEFRIDGLPEAIEGRGSGVDSMQALFMAMQGVRFHMERLTVPFTWLERRVGESGIPQNIPHVYGRKFTDHILEIIDRELETFVEDDPLMDDEDD